MKNNQQEEEQQKSLFQRFKDYMNGLAEKAKESAIVKAASNTYENISKTRAFKILTGKAVARGIGLVSIVVGAAGLFAVAPFALPIMAAGLVAGFAVDTYLTYRTKKVYQEAKMLRDNKVSLDKQNVILGKHPSISKALEGKLFTPYTKGNSKFEKPQSKTNPITSFLGGAGVAIAGSIGGIVNGVLLGNPVSTVIGLASSVIGIASEGGQKASLSETRGNLRNFIAEEQKKDYSPAYDDVKSLKDQVNKQRIQTLALEELSEIKGVDTWPPEKVQNKFREISNEIANRANKIQEGRSVFVKYGRKIFKNFVRAHDPFSKYTDPEKLNEVMKKETVVKQPEIEKQKEQVKTPKQMQHIVSPVKKNLEEKKDAPSQSVKLSRTARKSVSRHIE